MRITDLKRIFNNINKYKKKEKDTSVEYIFYRPVLIREKYGNQDVLQSLYGDKTITLHSKEMKNNYNQAFITLSQMKDICSDMLRHFKSGQYEYLFNDCSYFLELFLLICTSREISISAIDAQNKHHKRGVFDDGLYLSYVDVTEDSPLFKKYSDRAKNLDNGLKRIFMNKLIRDNIEAFGFNYICTTVGSFIHNKLKDKYECRIEGDMVYINIKVVSDNSVACVSKIADHDIYVTKFINKLLEETTECIDSLKDSRKYFISELSDVFCVFMRLIQILKLDFYGILNTIHDNQHTYGKFNLMVSKVSVEDKKPNMV